ncbi:hypothetical protein PGTUg99_013785 [Puccinia graminis f. sp. tritici]|uniref:Transcription factor domain-containing protein n=1 Tax=Puccinia graminis f. sp. tritici TaxID=56615 RepID=A0A5B0SKN7_PUCGR|nr:hypothetical protein PGTUg99_013785 [Puccinia graminis f. sp. tritici]
MQQSNPTPTPNLDELEVRGERIKERVDLNYSLAQELERSLDELDPQIQSLRQTSPTLTTFIQQPPTASAGYSMAPQPSKRLRCEIPPITPKTRPKIPVLAAKGYPLQKLSPDHDPTVPKAMAPVGLNPTSAQILDWPRRGDAAHRISFILNPNMNPAKENKRDLEPPSASSVNSQEADNPCSEESSRPSLQGLSDSFSTVSIPGSGTAAPIRLSGEDTDMEPKLMQMYCTTFFKRYSNRLTWSPTERASAESLKRASDLLLFAILSASDPKSTQPGMGSTYYQNALTMSRQTVFPENHVNLVMVLALAQDKLDPRNYSGCMSERKEKHVLPEISLVMLELDQWATDWKFQCPQLFTTKSMGPRRFLQNAQQYVTLYIMHAAIWPCQDGRMIITNQRRYQWALDGCHHAQNILEAVLDLKDEIDANEEDDSQLCPDDLPLNIEYHKATLGLVTGYLLWISLIIPGHVNLESYLGLFRRLHGLKFKFSCEYIEIIEKSILSIHEILSLQAIHPDPHHGLPDLDHQQLSYKIGTSLQEKGCQLGPNESRLGWVGEYRTADRTFRMGDDMAKELDKLMTDTQFWFQLELE